MKKIRTRKRGAKWYFSFEAGKKPDGKRNIIEKGGFTDEGSAYEAGMRSYNQWKYGIACTDHNKLTVREFMQNWLEHCRTRVRYATYVSYGTLVNGHLDFFGSTLLSDLTPMQCDAWLQDLIKSGYSSKTITTYKTNLSTALHYAVYPCQLLDSNPMAKIRMPKSLKNEVTKRTIISIERFHALMEIFPAGHSCHIPLQIAFHTGMRIGEILGLLWDNVDLDHGIIHVRTQLTTTIHNHQRITSDLKTPSSHRDVLIDQHLCSVLREWKNTQYLNHVLQGDSYVNNYANADGQILSCSASALTGSYKLIEPVCTAPKGNHIGRIVYPSQIRRNLKKVDLNSHSFRHTHATMLLSAGVPVKEISARLGHTNIDITEGLYVHSTREMQVRAKDAFEQLLQNCT